MTEPLGPTPGFLLEGRTIGPAAVRERPRPHEMVRAPDGVDLRKFAAELNRNRLDEIASAIRTLTYGEMMELARGFWKARGEAEITQATLPAVIHQWSGSRT